MILDNLNQEWEDIAEATIHYAEWLGKDIVEVLNEINSYDNLNDQVRIFNYIFNPTVFIKSKKFKWAMYGYDKH
tara:strand:+ start:667 stop:888 length:222 start_codon:yes stop_codon:yes gene_type:complete